MSTVSRKCIVCKADISQRGSTAKYCVPCRADRTRTYYRERNRKMYKSDPEFRKRLSKACVKYHMNRLKNDPEFREKERIRNKEGVRRRRRNPEFREREREYNRKRWAENPDHREYLKTFHRRRYREDPERYREYAIQRYRRVGHGYRKLENRKALLERDGDVCVLCGQILDKPLYSQETEVDHIMPVSKNGGNELSNLRLVHRYCNRRRHNMPTEEAQKIIRGSPGYQQ